MANQEYLDVLEQGVDEWNKWREENPEIRPDLHKANLSRGNLRLAYLHKASLRAANLGGTNLRGADLSGAYLLGAYLRGANLRGADLSGANLLGAYLLGAYLRLANLRRADLRGAKVWDRQLAECSELWGAIMPDVSRYDGRFSLEGDIAFAREEGIKTDDSSAMARWYAGDD